MKCTLASGPASSTGYVHYILLVRDSFDPDLRTREYILMERVTKNCRLKQSTKQGKGKNASKTTWIRGDITTIEWDSARQSEMHLHFLSTIIISQILLSHVQGIKKKIPQ